MAPFGRCAHVADSLARSAFGFASVRSAYCPSLLLAEADANKYHMRLAIGCGADDLVVGQFNEPTGRLRLSFYACPA